MKEYIYQNKFVLQIYKLKKISQWNFSEDFLLIYSKHTVCQFKTL